jgi:predicted acylesterase/phospholipase RssA
MLNADTDKTKYEYDVVTGVSVGSINAAGVALHDKGDEMNLIEFLSECW